MIVFDILAALIALALPQPEDATTIYHSCVAENARDFATHRDLSNPVDAAMAQCEPFLAGAAAELKRMAGDHGLQTLKAEYHAEHGRDPNLDLLLPTWCAVPAARWRRAS